MVAQQHRAIENLPELFEESLDILLHGREVAHFRIDTSLWVKDVEILLRRECVDFFRLTPRTGHEAEVRVLIWLNAYQNNANRGKTIDFAENSTLVTKP